MNFNLWLGKNFSIDINDCTPDEVAETLHKIGIELTKEIDGEIAVGEGVLYDDPYDCYYYHQFKSALERIEELEEERDGWKNKYEDSKKRVWECYRELVNKLGVDIGEINV